MSSDQHTSKHESKAKRTFLLNLTLCALLVTFFTIHHLCSTPEAETALLAKTPTNEPLSALKLANKMGQAQGLAEDPKVYFRSKKRHLTTSAKLAIEQMEQCLDVTIDANPDTLIQAYMDGYHARFEEYYSDKDGYEAGILYGVKWDPTRYKMASEQQIGGMLNKYESIVLDKYEIDQIQWKIFRRGFIKGYEYGYIKTQEGITLKVIQNVKLIEP